LSRSRHRWMSPCEARIRATEKERKFSAIPPLMEGVYPPRASPLRKYQPRRSAEEGEAVPGKQAAVGGNQLHVIVCRGGRQQPVGRIPVLQPHTCGSHGDCHRERRLTVTLPGQAHLHPGRNFAIELQALPFHQQYELPGAYRRYPQLVAGIAQHPRGSRLQTLRLQFVPKPDVGVEQQLHGRRCARARGPRFRAASPRSASQSSSWLIGVTMSPRIRPVCASRPASRRRNLPWPAGPISATGAPKRVTNTGSPVCRTRSSTARQVALNFEMAICSIAKSYHGQKKMVRVAPGHFWKVRHSLSLPGACAPDASLRSAPLGRDGIGRAERQAEVFPRRRYGTWKGTPFLGLDLACGEATRPSPREAKPCARLLPPLRVAPGRGSGDPSPATLERRRKRGDQRSWPGPPRQLLMVRVAPGHFWKVRRSRARGSCRLCRLRRAGAQGTPARQRWKGGESGVASIAGRGPRANY